MIIFYDKKTGKIEGTIDGRIHGEMHLKMWIGDKNETERLIINWIPVKDYFDEKGVLIAKDFSPEIEDNKEKELFVELDQKPSLIKNYKIDIETKKLVEKEPS